MYKKHSSFSLFSILVIEVFRTNGWNQYWLRGFCVQNYVRSIHSWKSFVESFGSYTRTGQCSLLAPFVSLQLEGKFVGDVLETVDSLSAVGWVSCVLGLFSTTLPLHQECGKRSRKDWQGWSPCRGPKGRQCWLRRLSLEFSENFNESWFKVSFLN